LSATNATYGGSAKYQCYDGFSFSTGKKEEEIYCTDEGRWTPPPVCRTQTCPALPPFDAGVQVLTHGDGTGFGTVYEYSCAAGYYREGAPALLCRADGTWSGVQPQCRRLPCFTLPSMRNGRVKGTHKIYHFEDTTTVVCHPGYRAVGETTIQCLANQMFSQLPQCVGE
jgi:CUB/sushi domain-containing protein